MTVPTSQRLVTIHVMGADGKCAGRQSISLGELSWRCLQGACLTGAKRHGWPCPVAPRCSKVMPEAWAKYLRLHELDRLGR